MAHSPQPMTIRPTTRADLSEVMDMYAIARTFMQQNGNPNQWVNDYPSQALIESEIATKHSFVCQNDNGKIIGTFCFILGDDPTYTTIYDGAWLNNAPYGTVHRIASSGVQKGVAKTCFDWCFTQIPNVRVDTHRENTVMQHLLTQYGFRYCGIIHLANGAERLAYQKTI